ncbi:MAG: NAD(P)H-dependent oxidoreductase [Reyranellaceae bacterium]
MARSVLIINGHPDPDSRGLCHAIAECYAEGATEAGHTVHRIDVARLDVPFLRSQAEFTSGTPPPAIAHAQDQLIAASHLMVVFPLWLGSMPAKLTAFFEQTLRPGFAFEDGPHGLPRGRLKGRSARIVATMGMPAWLYRWYFGGHGVRNLERNVLRFVGFAPVRTTLLGSVATRGGGSLEAALDGLKTLGGDAA